MKVNLRKKSVLLRKNATKSTGCAGKEGHSEALTYVKSPPDWSEDYKRIWGAAISPIHPFPATKLQHGKIFSALGGMTSVSKRNSQTLLWEEPAPLGPIICRSDRSDTIPSCGFHPRWR